MPVLGFYTRNGTRRPITQRVTHRSIVSEHDKWQDLMYDILKSLSEGAKTKPEIFRSVRRAEGGYNHKRASDVLEYLADKGLIHESEQMTETSCPYCQFEFETPRALFLHEQNVHPKSKYIATPKGREWMSKLNELRDMMNPSDLEDVKSNYDYHPI